MPRLYQEGFTQNRELSWLRYNTRILEEALDNSVPLLERLRFLDICDHNLDEFFQVRVGSLIRDDEEGDDDIDENSGMSPSAQLASIYEEIPAIYERMNEAYSSIEAALVQKGLRRLDAGALTDSEERLVSRYAKTSVIPSLDIKLVHGEGDFPELAGSRPYIMCRLASSRGNMYAVADIGDEAPSVFLLDDGVGDYGEVRYILTEDIVKRALHAFLEPFEVIEILSFRITRSSELSTALESGNPLKEMSNLIRDRGRLDADRLVCDAMPSDELSDFLAEVLELDKSQIYVASRTSYTYVSELADKLPARLAHSLCYESHTPLNQLQMMNKSVMEMVKTRDLLSAYPYDSMDVLLELLREAAHSGDVRELRISIYRVAKNSAIENALIEAARSGVRVRVIIEL